ncbi:uncharacterized protein LOC109596389 [Aethina tumida]|uniref:uncharacterized protein LOC109596389 n=1 Tax=Aethina tumida TaxID=116153 RepID=UPI0021491E56|nr:uncharacterized protein LOC109596389 [Aethina tumida]
MSRCLVITLIGRPNIGKTEFIKNCVSLLNKRRDFEIVRFAACSFSATYAQLQKFLGHSNDPNFGKKKVIILDANMDLEKREAISMLCKSYRASYGQFYFKIEQTRLRLKTVPASDVANNCIGKYISQNFKVIIEPKYLLPWERNYLIIELDIGFLGFVLDLHFALCFMEENLKVNNTEDIFF